MEKRNEVSAIMQLSSSSKNVSKIPRCVKTKMNREQCVALPPSYRRNALGCWPGTVPSVHPHSPAPKEGPGHPEHVSDAAPSEC